MYVCMYVLNRRIEMGAHALFMNFILSSSSSTRYFGKR